MKKDGTFIFSQEHPLNTATTKGGSFTYDCDGKLLHFNLDSYMVSGERHEKWMVDDVVKYHRTFSDIINGLTNSGFRISKMAEPLPDKELSKDDPKRDSRLAKRLHRPIFSFSESRKEWMVPRLSLFVHCGNAATESGFIKQVLEGYGAKDSHSR